MPHSFDQEQPGFESAVLGLRHGDFSRLAPLFSAPAGGRAPIIAWVDQGRFASDPVSLNEALACACFIGQTDAAEYLLAHGANLVAGAGTGLNGFHWAANRGQLDTVRALIRHGMPLEIPNSYGGTVLGGTVWAAIHEPRATQLAIIEALLQAGGRVEAAEYPSGDAAVDALLRRYGATAVDPRSDA
jgi:ankyrin repeat protein